MYLYTGSVCKERLSMHKLNNHVVSIFLFPLRDHMADSVHSREVEVVVLLDIS